MTISSSKKTEDNERSGGSTLKLDDVKLNSLFVRVKDEYLERYNIKQYICSTSTADILRQSLLDCEESIFETTRNSADRGNRGYPTDTITGYAAYYNLVRDVEAWNVTGFPLIKAVVGDYLSLKSDERVGISCWGNILRMDRKIFPHLHFGVPDGWEETKQSVSANIFLGSEVSTATTYILDGEQVDIPNVYGQFTLFPPNLPHAVRAYKGSGVRVSAAFDIFCPDRDTDGKVDGGEWLQWRQP